MCVTSRGWNLYLCIVMALLLQAMTSHSVEFSATDDCRAGICCEGSSCYPEQILLQKTQTRLASTGSHSEQQSLDAPGLKAYKVPLSEDGYKTIASLKNEREMAVFVKRVADELGYSIVDEGSLNGVVPYYSGTKATQSFVALTVELSRTSKQRKGWAKKDSLARKAAFAPKDSSEPILLQESHTVVSKRPQASFVESKSKVAEGVPLNEEGYKTILELNDEREMASFIERVAKQHGYEIADIGSLNGVAPYYSGKKARQSFVALTAELGRTSKQRKGWAKKARGGAVGPMDQVLLQESQKVIMKSTGSSDRPQHSSSKSSQAKSSDDSNTAPTSKAMDVPLSEDGYKSIAKLKDDKEMALFVKRVADDLGYEISDEVGSLNGVVPYYSGKKATQSFMALKEEFNRTSKQAKGWAKKPVKKTIDKTSPHTAMIEEKDESKHEAKKSKDGAVKQEKVKLSAAKALKKKAAKK